MAEYLKAQFPQYPVVDPANFPESPSNDYQVDTSILKSLGHEDFIPYEQTLKDMIDSLIALGIVEHKQK